jgi:hypothetical protein
LRNADQKTSRETNVKLSDGKEYYVDLNNNVKDHIDIKIENSLNEVEKPPLFNELDFSISESEVTKTIKSLRNCKSCGLSLILNELLKYGQLYLMPLIHKLFNLVFTNGIYPKSWSIGNNLVLFMIPPIIEESLLVTV